MSVVPPKQKSRYVKLADCSPEVATLRRQKEKDRRLARKEKLLALDQAPPPAPVTPTPTPPPTPVPVVVASTKTVRAKKQKTGESHPTEATSSKPYSVARKAKSTSA